MNRLYVPTLGPTDWRRLLADPDTQWKRFQSALEMAVCWEGARASVRGLPPEIGEAIDTAPELRGASLIIGLPEHKVQFEGGGHPSQNDLWALLRVGDNFISMAIEAKAGEKLDDLVSVWLTKKSSERSNKPEKLADLQRRLGIAGADVSTIRYQLLHRTASALKEAERFAARYALLIVQSFNRAADEQSWQDFIHFGNVMGVTAAEGRIVASPRSTAVPLFISWVTSQPATLELLGAAV